MMTLGQTEISGMMLGGEEVTKAYLGNAIVYEKSAGMPKVGDYIYRDGTFSSGYNSSKELAGIMYAMGISVWNGSLAYSTCIIHPKAFGVGVYGPSQPLSPTIAFATYEEGINDDAIQSLSIYKCQQARMLATYYGMPGIGVWNGVWASQTVSPDNPDQFPAFGLLYKQAFLLPGTSSGSEVRYGTPSLWDWKQIYENSLLLEEKLYKCGGDLIADHPYYWTCNAPDITSDLQWIIEMYPGNHIAYDKASRYEDGIAYRACAFLVFNASTGKFVL